MTIAAVARLWQRDPHRDRARGVEPGAPVEQANEAAQQKTCADEENEGQRDLDDHEGAARAFSTRTGSGAPAILERVRQRRTGCRQRRDGPEDQPADERGGEREEQHVRIDADHLESLNWQPLGDDGAEEPKCPPCQEESTEAADARENEALGQQLSDESRPPGAERSAHGELSLTGGRARQQEVGDVGAGYQQNKGDRGGEHDQGGSDVTGQLLAQQHHARRPARVEGGEHLASGSRTRASCRVARARL